MTNKVAHCGIGAQSNFESLHALVNGYQQDWLATAPCDKNLPA